MTRQGTIDRALQLENKPGLVCIGRFYVDGKVVDFPYSEEDLDRDAEFWRSVLTDYGVTRGKRVVITSMAWEVPQFQAVRVGVMRAGGTFSNSEFWSWDARRLDLFIRRLEPHMVIGPGSQSIEGLGNMVDLHERLSGVPHVLVRPDASELLTEAGVEHAGVVVPIGPAVAVTMPDGHIAVDEHEWAVQERDGRFAVTSIGPRAARFDQQITDVRGLVDSASGRAGLILSRDEAEGVTSEAGLSLG
jgi:hypothetical protein